MGFGNAGGMSAGAFGSLSSSSSGGFFGSDQATGPSYEGGDMTGQFGSMAGSGQAGGFPASYYDNTAGQYGQ